MTLISWVNWKIPESMTCSILEGPLINLKSSSRRYTMQICIEVASKVLLSSERGLHTQRHFRIYEKMR